MKKHLFLFAAIVFLFNCSQNKKTEGPAVPKTDTAAVEFFPVTSFLQGQMQLLDSLPVTILQLTTANGKTDSVWLPTVKVKPQLQAFLSDSIGKSNLANLFKETKFNDQSTDAITFMYGPKSELPGNIRLRRWDVYVDPEKSTVKRIFIVRQVKENSIASMQQLTWQTGKWAKIVTIKDEPGAKPGEIKWVWDLNE